MFSFFHFFRPFHIYTAVHPHFPHVCAEKKKKRKNEKTYFLFYCSTVIAGRIQLGNNHHVNTYDNMLFFVFSFFRFIYIIAKKRKIGKHKRLLRGPTLSRQDAKFLSLRIKRTFSSTKSMKRKHPRPNLSADANS